MIRIVIMTTAKVIYKLKVKIFLKTGDWSNVVIDGQNHVQNW